jgi:hypothetical protein
LDGELDEIRKEHAQRLEEELKKLREQHGQQVVLLA